MNLVNDKNNLIKIFNETDMKSKYNFYINHMKNRENELEKQKISKLYELYENINFIKNTEKYDKKEFYKICNGRTGWLMYSNKTKFLGYLSEGGQAKIGLYLRRKHINFDKNPDIQYFQVVNDTMIFLHGLKIKLKEFFKNKSNRYVYNIVIGRKVFNRNMKLPKFTYKNSYYKIIPKNKKCIRLKFEEFIEVKRIGHDIESKFIVGKIFNKRDHYNKEKLIYNKLNKIINNNDTIKLLNYNDNNMIIFFDYLHNYRNLKEFQEEYFIDKHKRQRLLYNTSNSFYNDEFYNFNNVECKETLLNFDVWLNLVKNILESVQFIHSKNIFHRDLTPGNIMISNSNQNVLLIDFGFSWIAEDKLNDDINNDNIKIRKAVNNFTTSRVGTLRFIAPEVLNYKGKYDAEKADIWSLGCIMYYLLFGTYPYTSPLKIDKNLTNENSFKKYYENDIIEQVEKCCYNSKMFTESQVELISNLINQCKQIEPVNRGYVKELLKYIEDYNISERKNILDFNNINDYGMIRINSN
jgi:serine/threonine protein kinase